MNTRSPQYQDSRPSVATGAVGRELLLCLECRRFPLSRLRLFASVRSAGQTLPFADAELPVEVLSEHSFARIDIAAPSRHRASAPVSAFAR